MAMSARHVIYFALLVAVLSGTAVLGFKEEAYRENVYGEPTPNPVQVETTVGFVKLIVNLDKTIYRVGEPINITVTLANFGNKTIFLSGSSPPVLGFVVHNVFNRVIDSGPCGGIQMVVSYNIEPGKSLNMTFTWCQQEKIAYYPKAVYQPVEPGTYFIVGRTPPNAHVLYEEDGNVKEITMETPKLPIVIVPKEGAVAEATIFPLRLTMILNKTTFEVNDPVKIAFFLDNIGNETLTFVFSCGIERWSFVVYSDLGFLVYNDDMHGYPQIYIPMQFPPNSSTFTTPLVWHQKLLPGRYRIVGQFVSGHLNIKVETPPVIITIS